MPYPRINSYLNYSLRYHNIPKLFSLFHIPNFLNIPHPLIKITTIPTSLNEMGNLDFLCSLSPKIAFVP